MKKFWVILACFAAFGASVGALTGDVTCLVLNLVGLGFDIYMIERA